MKRKWIKMNWIINFICLVYFWKIISKEIFQKLKVVKWFCVFLLLVKAKIRHKFMNALTKLPVSFASFVFCKLIPNYQWQKIFKYSNEAIIRFWHSCGTVGSTVWNCRSIHTKHWHFISHHITLTIQSQTSVGLLFIYLHSEDCVLWCERYLHRSISIFSTILLFVSFSNQFFFLTCCKYIWKWIIYGNHKTHIWEISADSI